VRACERACVRVYVCVPLWHGFTTITNGLDNNSDNNTINVIKTHLFRATSFYYKKSGQRIFTQVKIFIQSNKKTDL